MVDPPSFAASTLTIREARDEDRPQMWPNIHDISTEQQTFAYNPDMSEHVAKQMWLLAAFNAVVDTNTAAVRLYESRQRSLAP